MGNNDNTNGELKENYSFKKDISSDFVKSKRNKSLTIIFVVILFLITNILCYIFGLNFATGSYLSSNGVRNLSSDIGDYRKFSLVRNLISRVYNGEYDNSLLIDSAIKGMVDSLGDPYTTYMDKNEFYDFNLRSKGNYVGIGIQVAAKDGKIAIVSVFDNSPAQRIGIWSGDYIIEVSGEKVDGDNIEKAISLIKGQENTKVSLKVERKGEEISFDVEREKIDIIPVEYEEVEDGILYMKINSFDENSYKGVKDALNATKPEGIIIDLRGNPGGLLNECVDIVSEFLKEGEVIVSTDDKYGNHEVIKAKKGGYENTPIVILGDSGSASASEVLIGALKDHGRATFVGSQTFGKGLVQRVFEFGDGSGLKVTVSKYYTPNGSYINKVGISPDFEVQYSQEEMLSNKEKAKDDKSLLKKLDPQYQKALEIMKEKINN